MIQYLYSDQESYIECWSKKLPTNTDREREVHRDGFPDAKTKNRRTKVWPNSFFSVKTEDESFSSV